MPAGQSGLLDGWGNQFNLLDSSGNPVASGGTIATVQSNGSGSNGPYNAPLSVSIQPPPIAVAGYIYMQSSSGSISNPSSGSQVYVRLFGPNPSTGGVQELLLTVTTGSDGVVSFAMPSGTAVYAPGFLRAYLGGSTRAAATSRSNIVQFLRSEAGITSLPIVIRHMKTSCPNTILFVTRDRLVRADLRAGRTIDVTEINEEHRLAADDLPSQVEAALRLSKRRPGRVWILAGEIWTQTLGACAGSPLRPFAG